jgi:hypothetical protein
VHWCTRRLARVRCRECCESVVEGIMISCMHTRVHYSRRESRVLQRHTIPSPISLLLDIAQLGLSSRDPQTWIVEWTVMVVHRWEANSTFVSRSLILVGWEPNERRR